MARYEVNCNAVAPGPTDTPLVAEVQESDLGEKILGGMERQVPLGRMAQPEDIAGGVAFLASADADFITGQVLSVSGGLTMWLVRKILAPEGFSGYDQFLNLWSSVADFETDGIPQALFDAEIARVAVVTVVNETCGWCAYYTVGQKYVTIHRC